MSTLAKLNILIGANADEVEKVFGDVSKKFDRMGRKLQNVGKNLTTKVTLPLAAVGAASFKMASDAEEAANKFDVVMGASADAVRSKLEDLTETIPLTRSEMEGLAAGIQDMLVPMGLARDEAAFMSADMVNLAGDLASFNNVTPDQVLEAMQSALAGASEPMRRFGVDTRVARLEALALEEGLIQAGEALDNTSTAQAVMLAIQRDSTDAMGDAARTVESTANQYKFLFRNVRELAITIGDILIPVLTPMIQQMNDLVSWLTDLDRVTQTAIVAVSGLAAVAGPLLVTIGTMARLVPLLGAGFAALTGPVGVISVAVATLGFAAVTFIKNWDAVKVRFQLLWMAMQQATLGAIDVMLGGLEKLAGWVPGLGDKISDLRDDFQRFADEAIANAGDKLTRLERELAANAATADAVAPSFAAVRTEVEGIANAAGAASTNLQAMADSYGVQVLDPQSRRDSGIDTGSIDTPGVEPTEAVTEAGRQGVEVFEELSSTVDGFVSQGVNAMLDFSDGAGAAFAEFAKQATQEIARVIAKLLILKALNAATGGALDKIGIPGFATGGSFSGTGPFIAGEQGPELVVPNTGGSVFTASQTMAMAGGGSGDMGEIADAIRSISRPMHPHDQAREAGFLRVIEKAVEIATRRGGI